MTYTITYIHQISNLCIAVPIHVHLKKIRRVISLEILGKGKSASWVGNPCASHTLRLKNIIAKSLSHEISLCASFLYRLQLPKEKRLTPLQARVTSLLLQQQPSSTLWLGLGSGHLLLVNATTRIPLMAIKRQVSAVRGLLSVRALVGEKPAHLILSGGFGFQQRPTTSSHTNGGMWICDVYVAMWSQ